MFTKKKNYRTFIYTALVITLCLLIIALLWPKDQQSGDQRVNAQTQTQEDQREDVKTPQDKDEDNGDKQAEASGETEQDDKKPDISEEAQSYYVVRKDGSQICVYFSSVSGSEVKLETTDILYDLLPLDDQKAFEEGVKVNTQEELAALLQDFES